MGSVPWGIGQATFADYIDSILRLVDATFRPVFGNYRDWSLLPAALLARRLAEGAVAKVMGENFLQLFERVAARSARRASGASPS